MTIRKSRCPFHSPNFNSPNSNYRVRVRLGIGFGELKFGELKRNRKSHMRFRLVPKLTILDELERPLCTLFQNTSVFGANYENLSEDSRTQVISGDDAAQ